MWSNNYLIPTLLICALIVRRDGNADQLKIEPVGAASSKLLRQATDPSRKHLVQQGETLEQIAGHYQVSVDELKKANKNKVKGRMSKKTGHYTEYFFAGDKVVIPIGSHPGTKPAATSTSVDPSGGKSKEPPQNDEELLAALLRDAFPKGTISLEPSPLKGLSTRTGQDGRKSAGVPSNEKKEEREPLLTVERQVSWADGALKQSVEAHIRGLEIARKIFKDNGTVAVLKEVSVSLDPGSQPSAGGARILGNLGMSFEIVNLEVARAFKKGGEGKVAIGLLAFGEYQKDSIDRSFKGGFRIESELQYTFPKQKRLSVFINGGIELDREKGAWNLQTPLGGGLRWQIFKTR